MRDVAERAGVSVTTVSHVINKTRPVSDELRKRVLAVMAELGYQPNLLARSLRRGQTHTIGVIVPDSADPYFAEVARGIEDASLKQGYSIILCNSDNDLDKGQFYINVLTEKQVDGILFVSVDVSTDHIRALQARRMPLVLVEREVVGVEADSVTTDNAKGGWLATQHLLDLGHRRIGCIAGPSDFTPSAERVTSYHRALKEAGIPMDKALIITGDFQHKSGYQAARRLLTMDDPPTAIFACNDVMAVAAMSAAAELGQQVPTDLSVVGFDDVRLAAFANPPLTTIVRPKFEMGSLAVTMLLERIHDTDLPPRQHMLDTSLLIRKSSAPLAAELG